MIVLKQFPDHCIRIQRLYKQDETFREICEDYVLCLESLRKTIAMENVKEWHLNELLEISQELKDEIMLKICE